jgi:hypothetical protein
MSYPILNIMNCQENDKHPFLQLNVSANEGEISLDLEFDEWEYQNNFNSLKKSKKLFIEQNINLKSKSKNIATLVLDKKTAFQLVNFIKSNFE